MTTIEVIGVYPVEAEEPLHLIEVQFHDMQSRAALDGITQEWPGRERSHWQVPYLEHILDASGDQVIVDWERTDKGPEDWKGDVRVVFYFHYLNFDRPLLSPCGELQVPRPVPLPLRLSNKITYIPA
jgi:hypothetical protein